MTTFRYALRSLKNDFSKAFFYCLTFILTSMFIFLFFNLSMGSEANVHFINSANDTATNVTIIVIIISMVIIFFANDFYIKNKAKDLAIRLVCGGTYTQLASFLLIQTFLILLIAIPCGILLGYAMVPLMNSLMTAFLGEPFQLRVVPSAIIMTTLIIVTVVFWTTFLNLSFAYRNTAVSLLNDRDIKLSGADTPLITMPSVIKHKGILSLILWLFPLPVFYLKRSLALIAAIVGLVGLNGVIRHVLDPYLNRTIDEAKIEDPISIASLGFLRSDLKIMKTSIYLFLGCAILLITMLVSSEQTAIETALILLSYTVMNLLQSLAIMFKFSTELSTRKRYFATLSQLGYEDSMIRKVIRNEIFLFYGFILGTSLIYVANVLCADVLAGAMGIASAWVLIASLMIPLVIALLLNWYYYARTVMPKAAKSITAD